MGSILCVYCESPCSSSLTPVDPYLGGRLLFSESGKRRKYTAYTGSRIYGLGKSGTSKDFEGVTGRATPQFARRQFVLTNNLS